MEPQVLPQAYLPLPPHPLVIVAVPTLPQLHHYSLGITVPCAYNIVAIYLLHCPQEVMLLGAGTRVLECSIVGYSTDQMHESVS